MSLGMFGGYLIAPRPWLPLAGSFVVPNRRSWTRSNPSSVVAPSVSLPPKRRVTGGEAKHMPSTCGHFFEYCPVGCTRRNRRESVESPRFLHR